MTSFADQEFERLSGVYHDAVRPFIEPGQPFALLDFPDHDNVGDSAIWDGEMAFFDAHAGRVASFVCTCNHDPAEVNDHLPEGPVFIHGGGNFGDIWSAHQNFRLRVFETLKGRPVVQLPQSVHFSDASVRDDTARAIAAHGQVTLLVRDRPSFEFVQKHFDCAVAMAPDAAVNIRHIPAPAPSVEILSFLRADHEASWGEAADVVAVLGEVTDWQPQSVRRLRDRVIRKALRGLPGTRGAAMAHRERTYRYEAAARVRGGVAQMAPGCCIVSDRLHAHLIASLMRRPHIVMDNFYGKISRHIEAWSDFGLATRVNSMAELQDALNSRSEAGG